jgi:hypothetical protein
MRDPAMAQNSIYLHHNTLQRAGWQAKRRCVWQLSGGAKTILFLPGCALSLCEAMTP